MAAPTLPTPTGTMGVHGGAKNIDINLMLDPKLTFMELKRVATKSPLLAVLGLQTIDQKVAINNGTLKSRGVKVIAQDFELPTVTVTEATDKSLATKEQVEVETKELVLDKILKINQTYDDGIWDVSKIGRFADMIAASRSAKLTEEVLKTIKGGATVQKVKGSTVRENFLNAWQQAIEENAQPENLVFVTSPSGYTSIIKDENFVRFGENRVENIERLGNSFTAGSFFGVPVVVETALAKETDLAAYLIDKSRIWAAVTNEKIIKLEPGYSGDLQTSLGFYDYFGCMSLDDFASVIKVTISVATKA